MAKGQQPVQMPRTQVSGPMGAKNLGKSYDGSKGGKGMRQTLKQAGRK